MCVAVELSQESYLKAPESLYNPTVVFSKFCVHGLATVKDMLFIAGPSSPIIEVRESINFMQTRELRASASSAGVNAMAACSHHNCLYVSACDNTLYRL